MNTPSRTFEFSKVCTVSRLYAVTESGKVSRIGKPGYLKPVPQKRGGYLAVALWENGKGKLCPIHVLVALAFRGPRPTPEHQAAHDDGNKLNNHWTNIIWKTRVENEADKVRHGTSNRGERNGQAKLTDAQVAEFIARVKAGETQASARADYGISSAAASLIARGLRRGK